MQLHSSNLSNENENRPCKNVFVKVHTSLFMIANKWKQLNVPQLIEWIKQKCDKYPDRFPWVTAQGGDIGVFWTQSTLEEIQKLAGETSPGETRFQHIG